MSIPKPKLLKFKYLRNLHTAMVKTHPTTQMFREFKYWIQFYSKRRDPMKFDKAQYSVQDWADFLSLILMVQPELTLYEDYWPVEIYYNFYMGNRRFGDVDPRYYEPRSAKSAMTSKVSYHDKFENAAASSSQRALNIRDDIRQSMSHTPSSNPSKSSDEDSVDPFGSRLGNRASRSDRSMTLPSQSPQSQKLPSINAAASSSSNAVPVLPKRLTWVNDPGLDASSPLSAQDHSKMKESVVVSCVKCGNAAIVKPIFRKRLVDLVGKMDLLSNLASLGIFLDQHLDELHRLKHDDLVKFFSEIPSNQITPLAKFQLIKSLQLQPFDIRKPALISCPSLDIERRLTDLDRHLDKDLFQRTMKLEDDDFQELMDAMETMSLDYFSIYRPNTDQLCKVIMKIIDSKLRVLDRYENYWPLKFYLEHRSASVGTRPLYSEIEAKAVFSQVFASKDQYLPTLMQLSCELHPPTNISHVSDSLHARLHALGITGLIPALAYIGVHSDAQFAYFCNLNDQEKDDLFILGRLKLSQFQRFTLHLALSAGNQ